MGLAWTGRKEQGKDDSAARAVEMPATAADAPGEEASLPALAQRLEQLEAGLREAVRGAAYLAGRASSAPAAAAHLPSLEAAVEKLDRKLSAVAERLDGLAALIAAAPMPTAAVNSVVPPEPVVSEPSDIVARFAAQEPAAMAPRSDESRTPAGATAWQRVILGRALVEHAELSEPRQKLIDDVLDGTGSAMALAGQLLVFQSAPPERMSALLKDIGEAYYRWQPKTRPGATKLESALASWLQRACDDANLPNTIELVNPGERFDAARHTAAQRGVEITQVMGWIVLRDNGRVYTKALVSVK